MDLGIAPEMYFDGFPYRYDTDLLRCRPDAAQRPPTLPDGSWMKQARMASQLAGVQQKLVHLAIDCDRRLSDRVVPEFTQWVAQEKRRDLTALSTDQWCEVWTAYESRVMDQFAPEVLLPSMIAAMGLERLRAFLNEHFWMDDPDDLLNVLAVGEDVDCTVRSNEHLHAIGAGRGTCDAWLAKYGHRGPEEFDLAAPRWGEQPGEVQKLAAMLAASRSPVSFHHQRFAEAQRCAAELREGLNRRERQEFDRRLMLVRRYLPWREDGKAALMLGYDLLRDLALEAGRRLDIGSDVFLLSLDELCEMLRAREGAATHAGFWMSEAIPDRRRRRAAEKRLSLPLFIGSDQIESLGQPPKPISGRSFAAVPISTGSATGPVRIVHSPHEAGELGRGSILVCASTDPSWTPLFVDAAGLVLECGGMLSHGAVVAREMGIPAVVLPDATQLLDEGEAVVVDSQHGLVLREDATDPASQPVAAEPWDVRIATGKIPPVRGPRERRAATLRSVFFLIWGIYLAAVFLLPPVWCYRPSMKALDIILWPLVAGLGKPYAVAVMAAGLALLTMLGQRLLTDNHRLTVAKQRANRLRQEAAGLPAGSPRRIALGRAAAGIQARLLGAAFVPLAVLLGPMVMSFAWLPERVDPASWNPSPGAVAFLMATVDGEYTGPVRLQADAALTLDAQTPASQAAPPIRPALTDLLGTWKQPQESGARIPRAMMADLEAYLDSPIPPQELAWTIHTPTEAGRYLVRLSAGDEAPVHTYLVVGDRCPPEPKEDLGDGRGPLQVVRLHDDSAIRQIAVTYQFPRTLDDRMFFAPFQHIPGTILKERGWSRRDAGWLLTYIAAYLLALFPLRWLLRVP
jgi:pyruvate,water dikinase